MISAACHRVIFFAVTRKITSCTFIARFIAVLKWETMPRMDAYISAGDTLINRLTV